MASITASDFRARQRFEAVDAGTDYTDAQYDALRNDALLRLSRDIPADCSATIAVTSGVTTCTRPADFITMATTRIVPGSGDPGDPVYRLVRTDGTVLTLDSDYSFFGSTISLVTAPTATQNWTLYYGGTQTLTNLPDILVDALLHLATARLFDRKAAEASSKFSYSTASISVNKNDEKEKWEAERDTRMALYEHAIAPFRTNTSSVGTFSFDRT